MNEGTRRRRGGWLSGVIATLATVAALCMLIGLGTWQLERKAWKEALIARLNDRLSAPPIGLPPRPSWPQLDPGDREFRHVTFPAEFVHEQEALVYGAGSGLRKDATGPGYWVFTPARLAGGSVVMVNRGFVPEGLQDQAKRPDGQVKGFVDVVGVLRWPEPRGQFTPNDDPDKNIWFVRDHVSIADAKGVGPAAPFYVELESPAAPGGFPRAGRLEVNLTNNHLQYALTWFGLAATLVGVFGFWGVTRLRGRRREGAGQAEAF